ncbi:MAG: hypothetical protein ACR2QE_07290 [Acidimicrobiales bacterium]
MAAIDVSWVRADGVKGVIPKGVAAACVAALVAEVSYVVARVVSDVHRIDVEHRSRMD